MVANNLNFKYSCLSRGGVETKRNNKIWMSIFAPQYIYIYIILCLTSARPFFIEEQKKKKNEKQNCCYWSNKTSDQSQSFCGSAHDTFQPHSSKFSQTWSRTKVYLLKPATIINNPHIHTYIYIYTKKPRMSILRTLRIQILDPSPSRSPKPPLKSKSKKKKQRFFYFLPKTPKKMSFSFSFLWKIRTRSISRCNFWILGWTLSWYACLTFPRGHIFAAASLPASAERPSWRFSARPLAVACCPPLRYSVRHYPPSTEKQRGEK